MGSKSIGLLTMVFGADMKGFNNAMKKADRRVKKFGKNMTKLGRQMTTSITLPLIAIGGAAAKLSMDFDTAMTKIVTLVGISDTEVNKLRKSVLELAGKTAIAPEELANGLYFLTSAGLRGANAMETLETVAKGAASGLGEMKDLANVAAAAQNAYGEEVINSSRALDVFAGMVQQGMFESSELAQVLGTQLGLAANLGISMEEVGAFISTYTKTTGDANSATTGLGAVMMSFAKITPQMEDALQGAGMSIDGVRESLGKNGLQSTLIGMQKAFDKAGIDLSEFFSKSNALKGVLGVLGEQTETYVTILNDLGNSAGFVDGAFDRTAQTSGFKMKQALVEMKTAGIELGDTLAPTISLIADKIRQLSKWFRGLSDDQKKNITRWATIIATVGPAVYVFGKIVLAIRGIAAAFVALRAVMIAHPMMLLVGVIAGIVYAFKEWGGAVDKLTAKQRVHNQLQGAIRQEVGDEVTRVKFLTEQLEAQNLSMDMQNKYWNELARISPAYFGTLRDGTRDLSELTKVSDIYVQQLETQAGLQKSITFKTQAQFDLREEKVYLGRLKERLKNSIAPHITKHYIKEARAEIDNLEADIKEYDRYIGLYMKKQEIIQKYLSELGIDEDNDKTFDMKAFKKQMKEFEKMQKDMFLESATPTQKMQRNIKDLKTELDKLLGEDQTSEKVQKAIADKIKEINQEQTKLNEHTAKYNELLGEVKKTEPFELLRNAVKNTSKELKEAIIANDGSEEAERKVTEAAKNHKDALDELNEKQKEYNDLTKENTKETNVFADLLDKLVPEFELFGMKLGDIFRDYGESFQMTLDLMVGALNAWFEKSRTIINNFKKTKDKEYEEEAKREKDRIENSNLSEEAKARAIEQIDAKLADKKLKLEEETEAKLLKIKRRQAMLEKALAIASIIQNTAVAVMKVWAQTGIFGGPIAAAIVAAIGAAQIALIASTPIPLAEGGIISGPTHALMGEYPSAGAGNPEVVAPLNKLRNMIGDTKKDTIEVVGRLVGNDIYLSNKNAAANRYRTA